jgi:hypothetical protein
MVSTCLLAQARAAGSPWDRPELIYASLAIAGVLLAGGVVIWVVDRWRKRGLAPAADAAVAELTDFRGMLDRGEITAEEYNRLRQKVAGRVKPGPRTPPPAAAPPDPPPVPGPLPQEYFDDPPPPAPPAPPPGPP